MDFILLLISFENIASTIDKIIYYIYSENDINYDKNIISFHDISYYDLNKIIPYFHNNCGKKF